jgi:hypothetical protein
VAQVVVEKRSQVMGRDRCRWPLSQVIEEQLEVSLVGRFGAQVFGYQLGEGSILVL